MWVQWVKKSSSSSSAASPTPSSSRGRAHSRSPSLTSHQTTPLHFHPPPSPIHNHLSVSFKDVEALLNLDSPECPSSPIAPLHKRSVFYCSALRGRTAFHYSFKDVPTLVSEPDPTPSRKKGSIFHRVRAWASRHSQAAAIAPPESENRVVVYYTSLRVVRRTFEDCRAVRSILKGYRVKLDERDLSMDGVYVEELQRITAAVKREKEKDKGVIGLLPRVYVNGKLVGGVEEVRRLHESGELKKIVAALPKEEKGVCEACGGYRYVVCDRCDGSHRVFEDLNGEFVSCQGCKANGLVKCPCCISVHF